MLTHGPTHVLLSTSTFPMSRDDAVSARFVLDLAQHLSAHCRVTVLAPGGPRTASRERWGDVDVRRFQYVWPAGWQRLASGEGMVARMRSSRLAQAQAPGFVLAQWAALPRVARAVGADLLNPHWIVPQAVVAAGWARSLGLPMVVTAHGADVAWLDRSAWGAHVARRVFAVADGFLPVSTELAARTERRLGRPIPHTVIPMGVAVPGAGADAAAATVQRSPRTILFVGKLVPKKGVDVLLEAVAILRRDGTPVRLTIIGGGPLDETLRATAERLGIAPLTQFAGWVRNDRLPAHYAAADVVCLPSVRDADGETEGTPVVLLEALAAGALVVASRSSGIGDVLSDGANGLLVPPGDATALAAAIARGFAETPDARTALSRAARATAARYTWPQVAARYFDAFGEALRRRR